MKFQLSVMAGLLLAGCAVGPIYKPPAVSLPEHWRTPQSGELVDIQSWWAQFGDPALLTLQKTAQQNSSTLAEAVAAIDKARASRTSAGSGLWPSLDASASDSASGSLKNSSGVSRTASGALDASWELDLFGKTRRNVESADALIAYRQADWENSRVSLVAEVASDYLDYRTCRIKQHYYEAQATSQDLTVSMTRASWQAGFKAQADLRLAEASAASTHASALSQRTECEVSVKTLVALIGIDEPALRDILGADTMALPQPRGLAVNSIPADLLRQRPDIVSAERKLASTSALIGAAEAERWPSLSLSGSIGLSKTNGSSITAPWSFGPSLSLPLLDGGSISASIRSARADYASQLASYQQTVRDAVKEVEQDLVRLDSIAELEETTRQSAEGYRDYFTAAELSWRVGTSSQLDLESARRSSITADISLIELQQNRLSYWIALYKAVGGGWKINQGTPQ
jgi:outer membrane protein, multidrug efflux system